MSQVLNQFDLSETVDELKGRANEMANTAISFVKKYSLYAIAGALAIGVVTAMVFRGRQEQ